MAIDREDGWRARGVGLQRRTLLGTALWGAASGVALLNGAGVVLAADEGPFRHGVASGDPLATKVVIWTRVTPSVATSLPVRWQVALDPGFATIVRHGTVVTDDSVDFTVKVDVRGLQPGIDYHYRFTTRGVTSPVGRTRTLPRGSVSGFKLAVFSCSNFEGGYFNAYREAALRDDIDVVLHLGDYIYEYAGGLTGPTPRLDLLEPKREILSLADYRLRHATYKSDPDLQALHGRFPWITVWDDHEVTNDGRSGGAENHQPVTEGPWDERRARAVQAYYEWMPIREPARGQRLNPVSGRPDKLYRSFDIGDLARLVMIDTRLAGRDRQLENEALLAVYGAVTPTGEFPLDTVHGRARTMLGTEQEAWLEERLASSTQTWQLIGNQVLAFYQASTDVDGSDVVTPAQKAALLANIDALFGPGSGALFAQLGALGAPSLIAADTWTGYPTARGRFLAALAAARNPVVLTGDSHNAWVADLRGVGPLGIAPVGVEFGGTSVTSTGLEQFLVVVPPETLAALLVDSSQRKSPLDKLIYSDTSRRGFMVIDVAPERVEAEFVFVSSVQTTSYAVASERFLVTAGSRSVQPLS